MSGRPAGSAVGKWFLSANRQERVTLFWPRTPVGKFLTVDHQKCSSWWFSGVSWPFLAVRSVRYVIPFCNTTPKCSLQLVLNPLYSRFWGRGVWFIVAVMRGALQPVQTVCIAPYYSRFEPRTVCIALSKTAQKKFIYPSNHQTIGYWTIQQSYFFTKEHKMCMTEIRTHNLTTYGTKPPYHYTTHSIVSKRRILFFYTNSSVSYM